MSDCIGCEGPEGGGVCWGGFHCTVETCTRVYYGEGREVSKAVQCGRWGVAP